MPKRTKKEKIIAEYRRKLQSGAGHPTERFEQPAHQSVKLDRQPQIQNLPPTYQLKSAPPLAQPEGAVASSIDTNDLVAIRHDLTKTILLAAATIAIELLLYWRIGR